MAIFNHADSTDCFRLLCFHNYSGWIHTYWPGQVRWPCFEHFVCWGPCDRIRPYIAFSPPHLAIWSVAINNYLCLLCIAVHQTNSFILIVNTIYYNYSNNICPQNVLVEPSLFAVTTFTNGLGPFCNDREVPLYGKIQKCPFYNDIEVHPL